MRVLFFFFFLYSRFLLVILFFFFGCVGSSFSVRGLSPVAASGGHSSSWCVGLSLSRRLLLQSTGSRRAGSVVVAHGPSSSVACGIIPDQGSNPCPLHWQADSQPLHHQGSPSHPFYTHQCIHVSRNCPIHHTTIPTPLLLSPLRVHTFVLYICVSISVLQTSSSVPFF